MDSPTVDASGGQTGDVTTGDSAGGNIYHGLDPVLLRYLEGERNSRDASALAIIRIHERLDGMDKAARRAEHDAAMERAIDFEARLKRQAQMDGEFAVLRAGQALARRWIAALTLALVAVMLVIAWLVWREAVVFAVRAGFDVALSRVPRSFV